MAWLLVGTAVSPFKKKHHNRVFAIKNAGTALSIKKINKAERRKRNNEMYAKPGLYPSNINNYAALLNAKEMHIC